MNLPKRYGQSRVEHCIFCGKTGVLRNKEGMTVCMSHKESRLPEMKCACGKWLELRNGKFGSYFRCFDCGNISMKKVLDMNPLSKEIQKNSSKYFSETVNSKTGKKEITVRSDQVDCMY
ncbi:hypothetical protein HYU13_06560 [Candidatus Woesearchaeota archaeon]|nr:hypothetical protein [Candidatus Woesearchaeota archaeon]